MDLFIDTADFNQVVFAAGGGKKLHKKIYKVDSQKSHETLSKLEEFLKRFKMKDSRFKKIIVNKGPGSYTGVRVGLAMAQALGLAWEVPVMPKDKAWMGKLLE